MPIQCAGGFRQACVAEAFARCAPWQMSSRCSDGSPPRVASSVSSRGCTEVAGTGVVVDPQ